MPTPSHAEDTEAAARPSRLARFRSPTGTAYPGLPAKRVGTHGHRRGHARVCHAYQRAELKYSGSIWLG